MEGSGTKEESGTKGGRKDQEGKNEGSGMKEGRKDQGRKTEGPGTKDGIRDERRKDQGRRMEGWMKKVRRNEGRIQEGNKEGVGSKAGRKDQGQKKGGRKDQGGRKEEKKKGRKEGRNLFVFYAQSTVTVITANTRASRIRVLSQNRIMTLTENDRTTEQAVSYIVLRCSPRQHTQLERICGSCALSCLQIFF